LWPEEASFLVEKGLAKSDQSEISKYRNDVKAFYAYMRREGLFLTRDVNFKQMADYIMGVK
jgi:hypothetical protein